MQWDQNYNETINVVFGDEWFAGNLSYHLKSRPVWDRIYYKREVKLIIKIYMY